jgi:hypothetical protein
LLGGGIVLIILFLNQARIPGGVATKLKRFDWLGAILFTASSTAFLFGLTTGGVMYDWNSFRVILPLVLGLLGLIGVSFYEYKFAKEPMIPPGIFANRDMVLTYLMTIFHGIVLWSLVYFLSKSARAAASSHPLGTDELEALYYQAVKFYTPINSAVAVLPETLTVAPAGMIVGIVASITGHYRWSLWAGWIITTLGAGLLLLLTPDSTVVQWIFLNIPIGLGTGMLFPAMALSIQAATEPGLNAAAAAFFSFLRTFGQGVGVAIAGVIFQNAFRNKLLDLPAWAHAADEYSKDATVVVSVINAMPGSPEKTELVWAYNDALRSIWYALVAFSAAGMVLSAFIHGYSLNQEHITDQALVDKEAKKSNEKVAEP